MKEQARILRRIMGDRARELPFPELDERSRDVQYETVPVEMPDGSTRPFVIPRIVVTREGAYDVAPHPVFRRVLEPALDRSFRKKEDDPETERDLVGHIDANEDWASSL
jgi:hypothetical protein